MALTGDRLHQREAASPSAAAVKSAAGMVGAPRMPPPQLPPLPGAPTMPAAVLGVLEAAERSVSSRSVAKGGGHPASILLSPPRQRLQGGSPLLPAITVIVVDEEEREEEERGNLQEDGSPLKRGDWEQRREGFMERTPVLLPIGDAVCQHAVPLASTAVCQHAVPPASTAGTDTVRMRSHMRPLQGSGGNFGLVSLLRRTWAAGGGRDSLYGFATLSHLLPCRPLAP